MLTLILISVIMRMIWSRLGSAKMLLFCIVNFKHWKMHVYWNYAHGMLFLFLSLDWLGSGFFPTQLQMKNLTKEEFVQILRRQSTGFSRGSSKYRGVTLHKCGRWEARMGQFLGKKWGTTSSNLILKYHIVLGLAIKYTNLFSSVCFKLRPGLSFIEYWSRFPCLGNKYKMPIWKNRWLRTQFSSWGLQCLHCRYIYLGLFNSEVEAARS